MNPEQNALFYLILALGLFVYGYLKENVYALLGAIALALVTYYWLWKSKRKKQIKLIKPI